MRKAHGAVAYWSTPKPRTARKALWNAAHQVPPSKTRVLAGKASGGAAYWTYTKGAHRA